jgi:hypothetical protein
VKEFGSLNNDWSFHKSFKTPAGHAAKGPQLVVSRPIRVDLSLIEPFFDCIDEEKRGYNDETSSTTL